jgi:hypothetical protein
VRRANAYRERKSQMTSNQIVTVFGAYGHIGRFVVSELRNRGSTPILSGRDPDKNALGEVHAELDPRPASVDDAVSLDRALVGATSVIIIIAPDKKTSAAEREWLHWCRSVYRSSLRVTGKHEGTGSLLVCRPSASYRAWLEEKCRVQPLLRLARYIGK